ncbi:MAG TPA: hypothetical protein VGI66_18535 [Streptosporangiaceae bacterium]
MPLLAGRAKWPLLLLVLVLVLIVVVSCGTSSTPPGAGQAASVNLTLNTVPIVRSVTITATQRTFSNCHFGQPSQNTGSTYGQLGFPNGVCWLGVLPPYGTFPIKITNTGIASVIDVSGTNAVPVQPGGTSNQWSLCNTGDDAAVDCTGRHGKPGTDQYLLENFGPSGRINVSGLTDTPACDHEFTASGNCLVMQGGFQTEGVELTGPSDSTDTSTKWTVTITWTPVPGQGPD